MPLLPELFIKEQESVPHSLRSQIPATMRKHPRDRIVAAPRIHRKKLLTAKIVRSVEQERGS